MQEQVTTDVLVVGGGGAGLTASMLLSTMGVDHLLVSALPTTYPRQIASARRNSTRSMRSAVTPSASAVVAQARNPIRMCVTAIRH